MQVEDIIANVDEFVGQYVTVGGALTRVSQDGTWFLTSPHSDGQENPVLKMYLKEDDDHRSKYARLHYRRKVQSLDDIYFKLSPSEERDLVWQMYKSLASSDDAVAEEAINFFTSTVYEESLIHHYSNVISSTVASLSSVSWRHFHKWPQVWDDAEVQGQIARGIAGQIYLTNLTVIHARKDTFGIYINIEDSDTKHVFPLNRTCLTVQDVFRNFEELLGQEVVLEGYIAGKEMYGLEPFISDGFRSLIVPNVLHTLGKLRMNHAIFLDMPEYDERILNYVAMFYGGSAVYGGKVQLVGTVVESRMPHVFIGIDNVKFLATNPEGYVIYWKNADI